MENHCSMWSWTCHWEFLTYFELYSFGRKTIGPPAWLGRNGLPLESNLPKPAHLKKTILGFHCPFSYHLLRLMPIRTLTYRKRMTCSLQDQSSILKKLHVFFTLFLNTQSECLFFLRPVIPDRLKKKHNYEWNIYNRFLMEL
jgi:hypothetical protein